MRVRHLLPMLALFLAAPAASQDPAPATESADAESARAADVAAADAESATAYRILAEQGDAEAQDQLGRHYYAGRGVPEDPREAARWFRAAAEQGHREAQFNLATLYASGAGMPADLRQALVWYEAAAENGSVEAAEARVNVQAALAYAYQTGEGVAKNPERAAELYRAAAENGSASAQYNLAVMILEGSGVERSIVEAGLWMDRAAEAGVEDARTAMTAIRAGRYTKPADEAEVAALREAAEAGNLGAQIRLGRAHRAGAGVAKSGADAAKWFRLAAEQDLNVACEDLGGTLVAAGGPDVAEGLMWLHLCETEVPAAQDLLIRLQAEVSEEDWSAGRALADARRAELLAAAPAEAEEEAASEAPPESEEADAPADTAEGDSSAGGEPEDLPTDAPAEVR